MINPERRLAVVTGASSGMGLELARLCAQSNYDLIIAADEVAILDAAEELAASGVAISPVQCDLSSLEGVEALRNAIAASGKPVDVLIADSGRGLAHGTLDRDVNKVRKLAHTYIDGTIELIDYVSRTMRGRGRGRILVTGAIAGLMPSSDQAVYNCAKALLASFSVALRNELKHSGVTVTCLLPSASDSTYFADPKEIATAGYEAMMSGEPSVVRGFGEAMRVAVSEGAPEGRIAGMHRKMPAPRTA